MRPRVELAVSNSRSLGWIRRLPTISRAQTALKRQLRRWRRQFEKDPEQAFPGVGQRKSREDRRLLTEIRA